MSQTILYRPIALDKAREVRTFYPSHFTSAMSKVFGDPPWILENDPAIMRRLEGMAAVCREVEPNPYKQLIEEIENLGCIEVFIRLG